MEKSNRSWTARRNRRCRALINIKLFKPGHTKSVLNVFLSTHEILRIETYPHARQAGLGDYVGVTYREEDSDGEPGGKAPVSGD